MFNFLNTDLFVLCIVSVLAAAVLNFYLSKKMMLIPSVIKSTTPYEETLRIMRKFYLVSGFLCTLVMIEFAAWCYMLYLDYKTTIAAYVVSTVFFTIAWYAYYMVTGKKYLQVPTCN